MHSVLRLELREKISNSFGDSSSLIYIKSHWDNLDGKPVDYTPADHTHDVDEINTLVEGTSFSGNYPVLFNIGGANRIFSHSSIVFDGTLKTLKIDGNKVYHEGNKPSISDLGLQTALDGKVGLSGNETISGVKTFSSNILMEQYQKPKPTKILSKPIKKAVWVTPSKGSKITGKAIEPINAPR